MPDSRSLVIFADRLGFTGTGGGGMGASRVKRERWSALRMVSSSLSARDFEVDVMALEVGSRWIGTRVNVSGSSMMRIWMSRFL